MEDFESADINHVCRLCLNERKEMGTIHNSNVVDMIEECVNLQLTDYEKNHFICTQCILDLTHWYVYKQQVLTLFEIGRRLFKQNLLKLEPCSNFPNDDSLRSKTYPSLRSELSFKLISRKSSPATQPVVLYQPFEGEATQGDVCLNLIHKTPFDNSANPNKQMTTWKGKDMEDSNSLEDNSQKSFSYHGIKIAKKVQKELEQTNEKKFCTSMYKHMIHRSCSLTDELNTCTSRDFICTFCGSKFYKRMQLEKHRRIHNKERPFACNICECTFTCSALLKTHVQKIHKTVNWCSICNGKFPDAYQLKLHMRVHTGEKPYKCDQCSKTFAVNSLLKSHMKFIHSKSKDHACRFCGRNFVHKATLESHLQLHKITEGEKSYMCSICRKKYITEAQLKYHQKLKHEHTYTCGSCETTFRTKQEYNVHTKTSCSLKRSLSGSAAQRDSTKMIFQKVERK